MNIIQIRNFLRFTVVISDAGSNSFAKGAILSPSYIREKWEKHINLPIKDINCSLEFGDETKIWKSTWDSTLSSNDKIIPLYSLLFHSNKVMDILEYSDLFQKWTGLPPNGSTLNHKLHPDLEYIVDRYVESNSDNLIVFNRNTNLSKLGV